MTYNSSIFQIIPQVYCFGNHIILSLTCFEKLKQKGPLLSLPLCGFWIPWKQRKWEKGYLWFLHSGVLPTGSRHSWIQDNSLSLSCQNPCSSSSRRKTLEPLYSVSPTKPAEVSSVQDLFEFICSGPLIGKLGVTRDKVAESLDKWLLYGLYLSRLFKVNELSLTVPEKVRFYHYYIPVFLWCEDQISQHQSKFKDSDDFPPLVVQKRKIPLFLLLKEGLGLMIDANPSADWFQCTTGLWKNHAGLCSRIPFPSHKKVGSFPWNSQLYMWSKRRWKCSLMLDSQEGCYYINRWFLLHSRGSGNIHGTVKIFSLILFLKFLWGSDFDSPKMPFLPFWFKFFIDWRQNWGKKIREIVY